MKKLVKLALILFILVVLILLGGFWYWNNQLAPADPRNSEKYSFVVKKGESTIEIAQDLKSKGLIKSDLVFRGYLKLSKKAGNIQAGDFKLSPSMTIEEIVDQLSFGIVDKWVTLIEGWRVEEEAEEFQKSLGIKKEEFLKEAKEGYMFPDTYLFNKDVLVSDIVSKLENTFDQKYTPEIRAQIKNRGLTEKEGVILASIVEREARSDEVRTEVASILLRRYLKENMGLNADATLQYALGFQPIEKTWWKKALTNEDKKIDSPYNTYKYRGLPPEPICNPSVSSLKAVANADIKTPYLYYFHDNQGNTYYGRTLEEHNQNVAKHR